MAKAPGFELLKAFIHKRMTQKAFADDVGISESHLSLVLSGNRFISFGLAKRISKATGGKIPIEMLPHRDRVKYQQAAE